MPCFMPKTIVHVQSGWPTVTGAKAIPTSELFACANHFRAAILRYVGERPEVEAVIRLQVLQVAATVIKPSLHGSLPRDGLGAGA